MGELTNGVNGHPDSTNTKTTHSLCFYVPDPLHEDAYNYARAAGVDLILPDDERGQTWWECTRLTNPKSRFLLAQADGTQIAML
jgi:hypothetical protein